MPRGPGAPHRGWGVLWGWQGRLLTSQGLSHCPQSGSWMWSQVWLRVHIIREVYGNEAGLSGWEVSLQVGVSAWTARAHARPRQCCDAVSAVVSVKDEHWQCQSSSRCWLWCPTAVWEPFFRVTIRKGDAFGCMAWSCPEPQQSKPKEGACAQGTAKSHDPCHYPAPWSSWMLHQQWYFCCMISEESCRH